MYCVVDLICGAAGLDSLSVYRNLSGGGLDTRQLADTGEEAPSSAVGHLDYSSSVTAMSFVNNLATIPVPFYN